MTDIKTPVNTTTSAPIKTQMPSMTPSYVEAPVEAPIVQSNQAVSGNESESKAVNVEPKVEENKLKSLSKSKASETARKLREGKAAFKKEQEFKLQQENWKKEQAQALQAQQTLAEANRLVKTDPMKFLEFAGIKFEDLAKTVLKGDVRTPQEIAKQESERLFNQYKAEEQRKQAELLRKREIEQNQAFIDQSNQKLKALAAQDPDKFEFINSTNNSISLVWETIEDAFEASVDPETGQLSPESKEIFNPLNQEKLFLDALELVEGKLEEENFKLLSQSKKIKARLAKEKAEALEKEKQEQEAQRAVQGNTKIRNTRINNPIPSTETPRPVWPRNRLDISRKIISERIKKNDN